MDTVSLLIPYQTLLFINKCSRCIIAISSIQGIVHYKSFLFLNITAYSHLSYPKVKQGLMWLPSHFITSSLNFADNMFIIVEVYFIVHTHLQPKRAHMHDAYMYAGMYA